MFFITNLLLTALLVDLSTVHTLAEPPAAVTYFVTTFDDIKLDNYGINVITTFDVYLTIGNVQNECVIKIIDPVVLVGSTNLFLCPSMMKIKKEIEKTFTAHYTDTGLLKYITVSEDEPDLSRNLKFTLMSLLQVNQERTSIKLSNNKRKLIITPELIFAGKCPLIYDVSRTKQQGKNTVLVNKMYDMYNCEKSKVKITDPVGCSKNICPLNTDLTASLEVKLEMREGIIEKLESKSIVQYAASKNSVVTKTSIKKEPTAQIVLRSPLTSKTLMVTELSPGIRDTSICQNLANVKDKNIVDIFTALICEGSLYNYMYLAKAYVTCKK